MMQELGKCDLKINIILNGLEKYMSFSISNKLSLIDSFQFLSSSLDSLVKDLNKDSFKFLSQEFNNNVLDLVKQKLFYPHEYMSNFENFKEKLPSKEKFYCSLTSKKNSDKEYEHVLKVWNKFELKTMKNYHDLYLQRDVSLLAVFFEKLRNISLKNYVLYPSHYLSVSALSWDAMLNMAKVEIELFQDRGMYIFFEKGMTGGISYICNRYSEANKKYLKAYDPNQVAKHIIYLHANNLYGYVISKFLPTNGFKWIWIKFDLNKYTTNRSKRCLLEIDLEYPNQLRKLLNKYQLAQDKVDIKKEMLYDYQLKISDLNSIPIDNVKKIFA